MFSKYHCINMYLDEFKRKYWNPIVRGLTHDSDGKHYYRLKHAIWLYLYLLIEANHRTGRVLTTLEKISSDMGLDIQLLITFLGHLKRWNYVSTQKESGQILFKIAKWKSIPGLQELLEAKGKNADSSKKKQQKTKRALQEEHPLVKEIVTAFDDKGSQPYYEQLCAKYPEELILRTFKKVQALPDDKIKKSRGALFTYLLKQYASHQKKNSK